MAAYYNDSDRHCARWLRNLSAAGLIAAGDVDDRDIRDIPAADLAGYAQIHLFAGIGLWSNALRMAGWGDDRPVWTLSCPCQPFSAAGRGGGIFDDRHLWPAAHWLIGQCRPVALVGEQVASPDGLAWFDIVSADLDALSYACRQVDFPSAGVGAPNIRQRLWWVADADRAARLAHTEPSHLFGAGRRCEGRASPEPSSAPDPWRGAEWVVCLDGKRRPFEPGSFPLAPRHPGDVAKLRAYGNAINPHVAAEIVRAWMECSP